MNRKKDGRKKRWLFERGNAVSRWLAGQGDVMAVTFLKFVAAGTSAVAP